MDGQTATTSKRTPLGDLAHLVSAGVTPGTLETCEGVANLVLRELDMQGDLRSGGRAALLDEVLLGVIEEQRQVALAQLEAVSRDKASATACFQVAGAAELLGLTDERSFEKVRDLRCFQLATTWDVLESKDHHQKPKQKLELRAALWIGSGSAKTAGPTRRQPELLTALEMATPPYARRKRERLRALALSYLEQPSPNTAVSSASAQPSSPVPNATKVVGDPSVRHVTPSQEPALQRAIRNLADAVRHQLSDQERQRRVADPFWLPVRWTNITDARYVDHWENIRCDPGNSDPISLSGSLDSIVEKFRLIPSGRLVILGQGGAGKTTLAVALASALLGPADHLPEGPIPVVFNLTSWDPNSESLKSWMIKRIIDEYLGPSGTVQQEDVLMQLIRHVCILPILDGFDEMDSSARKDAIRAFNLTLNHEDKFVITSMPPEYFEAVDASHILSRAAVVVLEDLTFDDVAGYLPLTARRLGDESENRTKWDRVFSYMRARPEDSNSVNLLKVFATPLLVSLARQVYSDTSNDPKNLLDSDRFPGAMALSEYLIQQLIPTTYANLADDQDRNRKRSWRPYEAYRWLSYLASRLQSRGEHYFVWWSVWTPRSARVMRALGLIVGFVGAGLLVVAPPANAVSLTYWGSGALGLGMGVASRLDPHIGRDIRYTRPHPMAAAPVGVVFLMLIIAGSIGVLAAVALGYTAMLPILAAVEILAVVASIFGLLYSGLLFHPRSPDLSRSPGGPLGMLRLERVVSLKQGVASGIGCAILIVLPWVIAGSVHVVASALVLITASITGHVIGSASTAWLVARCWLASTRQLPWFAMRFFEGACELGILRRSGGAYQFRHSLLQETLARANVS